MSVIPFPMNAETAWASYQRLVLAGLDNPELRKDRAYNDEVILAFARYRDAFLAPEARHG